MAERSVKGSCGVAIAHRRSATAGPNKFTCTVTDPSSNTATYTTTLPIIAERIHHSKRLRSTSW